MYINATTIMVQTFMISPLRYISALKEKNQPKNLYLKARKRGEKQEKITSVFSFEINRYVINRTGTPLLGREGHKSLTFSLL